MIKRKYTLKINSSFVALALVNIKAHGPPIPTHRQNRRGRDQNGYSGGE